MSKIKRFIARWQASMSMWADSLEIDSPHPQTKTEYMHLYLKSLQAITSQISHPIASLHCICIHFCSFCNTWIAICDQPPIYIHTYLQITITYTTNELLYAPFFLDVGRQHSRGFVHSSIFEVTIISLQLLNSVFSIQK